MKMDYYRLTPYERHVMGLPSKVYGIEIENALDLYLEGEMSLSELEEWLVPATWNDDKIGDERAKKLGSSILLHLSEYSGGYRSEDELRVLFMEMLLETQKSLPTRIVFHCGLADHIHRGKNGDSPHFSSIADELYDYYVDFYNTHGREIPSKALVESIELCAYALDNRDFEDAHCELDNALEAALEVYAPTLLAILKRLYGGSPRWYD